MPAPPRILVVVDPTAAAQPAVERGAWLARHFAGARLELFISDFDPVLDSRAGERAAVSEARAALVESHTRRLLELAAPLAAEGIDVTVNARWDHPLHEAIVHKAIDAAADIVVKDTHFHSMLKRSILSNTDWNLIRNCPSALLLVKPRPVSLKPCIVAAIDPLHERDRSASLDHDILATAERFCGALGGELHAFHAFDIAPLIAASTEAMMMPIALPLDEITDALRLEHSSAVHALTDTHAIPRTRVHVEQGATRDSLLALTGDLRADVVVMGAVSRSGLERLFVGSTAEDVLDKLSCDLLIVKPERPAARA
jgi:universal stress protein E